MSLVLSVCLSRDYMYYIYVWAVCVCFRICIGEYAVFVLSWSTTLDSNHYDNEYVEEIFSKYRWDSTALRTINNSAMQRLSISNDINILFMKLLRIPTQKKQARVSADSTFARKEKQVIISAF